MVRPRTVPVSVAVGTSSGQWNTLGTNRVSVPDHGRPADVLIVAACIGLRGCARMSAWFCVDCREQHMTRLDLAVKALDARLRESTGLDVRSADRMVRLRTRLENGPHGRKGEIGLEELHHCSGGT
jgi:hypothetical protein